MLEEGKEYIKSLERVVFSGKELEEIGKKLKELYEKGKTLEEISIELEINPVSVAAMRKELELINPKDLKHEVENLLTYFIIEQLKKDNDGIVPISEETPEKPLVERLTQDLEDMFGEDHVSEILTEMRGILGMELDKWVSHQFFKKHMSQYKKRPIVWHLQSEDKSFEVLVYYHKLTNQTLQIIRNYYLSRAVEINKDRLRELEDRLKEAGNKEKGKIYDEIEEREDARDDLQSFGDALDEVIKTGYDPVIDDGVLANISPIQKAGLLAVDVLNKNQLKKGLELLAEYVEERKIAIKSAVAT